MIRSTKDSLSLHYKSKWKNWLFLEDELKPGLGFVRYAKVILYGLDLLVPLVIIFLVQKHEMEFGLLYFAFGLNFMFIAIYRPFTSKLENFTSGMNFFFYIVITILFHQVSRAKNLSEEEKYKKLGLRIIVVISLLLLGNLLIGVIQCFYSVKDMCKKRKSNKVTAKRQKTGVKSKSKEISSSDLNESGLRLMIKGDVAKFEKRREEQVERKQRETDAEKEDRKKRREYKKRVTIEELKQFGSKNLGIFKGGNQNRVIDDGNLPRVKQHSGLPKNKQSKLNSLRNPGSGSHFQMKRCSKKNEAVKRTKRNKQNSKF
jgi:hypothetical protein